MKVLSTNIVLGKKTRRKPKAGDIFSFQMEQFPERFYFGRVVATDTKIGGMDGGVVLIYIYKEFSIEKLNIPSFKPSNLLIPPIGTNNLPWTMGYFEVVRSGPNANSDLLSVHCFSDPRGWYVDEYGRRLSAPVEPVGFDGLSGMGAIDDKISKALGVPIKRELT